MAVHASAPAPRSFCGAFGGGRALRGDVRRPLSLAYRQVSDTKLLAVLGLAADAPSHCIEPAELPPVVPC